MFKHSPLDPSPDAIRLVEILPGDETEQVQCTLRNAKISDTEYTALSYECGSTTDPVGIELNAEQYYVTRNLHSFLLAARKRGVVESVWIDAICIHQSDNAEKSEQVKLMPRIYAGAKETYVWLGHCSVLSTVSLCELFDLTTPIAVPDLAERTRTKLQRWRKEGQESWIQHVKEICTRGYWSRLWIVQEFLISEYISVWIGSDVIPGRDFCAFLVEAAKPGYSYPSRPAPDGLATTKAMRLIKFRHGRVVLGGGARLRTREYLEKKSQHLEKPIEAVLVDHGEAECSDWHDRVYGLLSLVTDGARFPVDYSISKIDLISEVILFGRNHQSYSWPETLGISCFLTGKLGMQGQEHLEYAIRPHETNGTPPWKTLSWRLKGVVGTLERSDKFGL